MVPEGIKFVLFARVTCHECKKNVNFMPKGAKPILKSSAKKFLYDSFVMMQFS